MPEKRLPAIVDRAVCEKITKRRAGIRWDNVVEKIWKDLVGGQEEVLSIKKFGGYKTEVKETIEERERLALRNKVKEEKHLRDIPGVERRYWNENVAARPNGLREKAETAISCRGPGPTRKRYTSSREEDVDAHVCPCGTAIESRTHIVGACETCKEQRDALGEMRKFDVCDMEEFGRLESSEKTISILGDG